jgi:hypothetical protein
MAHDPRRTHGLSAARTPGLPPTLTPSLTPTLTPTFTPFAMRATIFAATLAVSGLASSAARADGVAVGSATPAETKQATEHFLAGKQARDAKSWDKAISELRASLSVVNSPNARLELARSLRESGALGDAWSEYGRVIDDASALAGAQPRYRQTADAATSERAEIESKNTLVTVTVLHAPPGAVLKVGGRQVASEKWKSPVVASPGAVDVVLVDANGKELARQTVAASAGRPASATVDAQPSPPPGPSPSQDPDDQPDFAKPAEPPPAAPSSGGRANLRPYAYVAGGIGVAGLAAFTVLGVMSNNDFNDLKSSCPGGRCPASKSGEISDGRTFQTLANVGLGVGIAGVAVGATLFVLSVTGKQESPQDATGLVVGPGYLGLRGTL